MIVPTGARATSSRFRTIQIHPKDFPADRRHSCHCIAHLDAVRVAERRDTMKAITELTIAAVAVALLVAAAVQINHAQASPPLAVVQAGR
jgi:hypothetical protein